MKRRANAVWNGGLKDGQGVFSVASGVIKDQTYGFRTRFEKVLKLEMTLELNVTA